MSIPQKVRARLFKIIHSAAKRTPGFNPWSSSYVMLRNSGFAPSTGGFQKEGSPFVGVRIKELQGIGDLSEGPLFDGNHFVS